MNTSHDTQGVAGELDQCYSGSCWQSVTQARQLGWGPSTTFECLALSAGSGQTGASPSWQLCQPVCSHRGCGAASLCVRLSWSESLQVQSCISKKAMATAVQQALSGCAGKHIP